MQEMTDETLSAYLDHELDEARRLQVEAEIARNPALARRLAALREADMLTREAFSEISGHAVPESLIRAASGTPTAPPRSRRLRVPSRLLPSAPMPVLAMGIAAGLILSLVLPLSRLPTTDGDGAVPVGSPMQLTGALADALDTTPSNTLYSAGKLTVAPLNTFRSETGRVCREYQARTTAQGSAMAGIACRDGGEGWTNEIVVSLGGSRTDQFAPATAGDGLKAMRPEWRDAEVMDQSEERTLLQRWAGRGN